MFSITHQKLYIPPISQRRPKCFKQRVMILSSSGHCESFTLSLHISMWIMQAWNIQSIACGDKIPASLFSNAFRLAQHISSTMRVVDCRAIFVLETVWRSWVNAGVVDSWKRWRTRRARLFILISAGLALRMRWCNQTYLSAIAIASQHIWEDFVPSSIINVNSFWSDESISIYVVGGGRLWICLWI